MLTPICMHTYMHVVSTFATPLPLPTNLALPTCRRTTISSGTSCILLTMRISRQQPQGPSAQLLPLFVTKE